MERIKARAIPRAYHHRAHQQMQTSINHMLLVERIVVEGQPCRRDARARVKYEAKLVAVYMMFRNHLWMGLFVNVLRTLWKDCFVV